MTTNEQCVEALRGFIERADREEIAEAQAAIIQFALSQPDLDARSEAMADLQQELAGSVGETLTDPMQQAYYAVVDAMIDRTRDAVLEPKA